MEINKELLTKKDWETLEETATLATILVIIAMLK